MTDHPSALFCRRFVRFGWSASLLVATLLAAVAASATGAAETTPVSVPRFTHPGAGQVCYFLLTDRFANGTAANDTGGIMGGPDISGFDPTRISHYHGGDFAGLTAKLDYLKNLGVTAVWVSPPFRNKPMQLGTAGYHGYWILDFLHVDPHLGSDADFHEFVKQAHARGLKVYLDIIVNHTADVIQYQGGVTTYVPKSAAPYRDASGQPFNEQAVAYNGLNAPEAFPRLSTERSFAYVPVVPSAETNAKNPAWLNNPVYYHNRGNSAFKGENSLHGDFVGLDDVFTEHPDAVRGFIDIYRHWLEDFAVDGFRIDTAKHVNVEFWQAFAPAIRDFARRAGRPGFIQFGEVMDETRNVAFLSEFSNTALLDTTLDFGFMQSAIAYVSKGEPAAAMESIFALDDYYTGPANNVHTTTTFLGNHDLGRFGYFLQRDNPAATPAQLADLVKLGHGLLFLSRGQPVIYYGDEQGMIGLVRTCFPPKRRTSARPSCSRRRGPGPTTSSTNGIRSSSPSTPSRPCALHIPRSVVARRSSGRPRFQACWHFPASSAANASNFLPSSTIPARPRSLRRCRPARRRAPRCSACTTRRTNPRSPLKS